MKWHYVILIGSLALASCDSGSKDSASPTGPENGATAKPPEPEQQKKLAACPFQKTSNWAASIRGGRLLVTGTVDLMMAGFKPVLTPREESAGRAAFDLALASDPAAAVDDHARFERSGSASYRSVSIFCGGKEIASVPVIHVG